MSPPTADSSPTDRMERSARVRLEVNGEEVEVWPCARWSDAVTAWDPGIGSALAAGRAWIADPRGNPVDPDGSVVAGAAIVVHSRPGGRKTP
ncbi:MAG: hypothetical protein R3199_05780 [Gemmatimonadota bacterium]|nr:hypothetical protein [Gemmatimonadota bacterium]